MSRVPGSSSLSVSCFSGFSLEVSGNQDAAKCQVKTAGRMRGIELASAEANAANGTVPRLLIVGFRVEQCRYVCSVDAVVCGPEAKVKLVFIKIRNES